MYILGIDTATQVAGAALINEDKVIAERFINNKLTHSEHLLPMISGVLEDGGIKSKDLGGIVVTKGPGSFTGVRIGMTVAKTMAQVLQIPIAGISTLDLIAQNLTGISGLICPILNAKKGEVYTALYASNIVDEPIPLSDKMERLTEYMAISIEALIELIREKDQRVFFLGDGIPSYSQQLKDDLGNLARICPSPIAQPRASWLAWMGAPLLSKGYREADLFMTPDYIRASEAEVTWAKKNGLNCSC